MKLKYCQKPKSHCHYMDSEGISAQRLRPSRRLQQMKLRSPTLSEVPLLEGRVISPGLLMEVFNLCQVREEPGGNLLLESLTSSTMSRPSWTVKFWGNLKKLISILSNTKKNFKKYILSLIFQDRQSQKTFTLYFSHTAISPWGQLSFLKEQTYACLLRDRSAVISLGSLPLERFVIYMWRLSFLPSADKQKGQ